MDFKISLQDGVSAVAKKAASGLDAFKSSLEGSGAKLKKFGEGMWDATKFVLKFTAALGLVKAAVDLVGLGFLVLGAQASEAKGDMVRSLELLYGSQEAAEHTYKVLEGITGRIAISQDRVMELADSLTKAGQVNGDQMVASIEAIGKAEAARKGAGQVLESVITQSVKSRAFSINREQLMAVGISYRQMAQAIAKNTGRGVAEAEIQLRTGGVRLKAGLDALNDVVEERMGKLAREKFMTVGNQVQRLKDGFKRLFENFNTGPVARGIKVIADLFDETTVSGSSLRTLLGSIWDEIGSAIQAVAPYVETFFKGLILFGLKVWNALYPLRKAIKETFGGDQTQGLETFQGALLAFADDLGAFVGKFAEFAADIVRNWDALWQTFDEIMSDPIGAILGGFGEMFTSLNSLLEDGWRALVEGAVNAGKALVDGIVNGIKAGAGFVADAMKDMASAGLNKFKDVFGIHSPSRVMAQQGRYLNEGLAQGVESSADRPASAMADTSGGITAGAQAGARGGNTTNAPSFSIVFQQGAIVIQGGGTDDNLDSLRDKLTEIMGDMFQQAALLQGAGA